MVELEVGEEVMSPGKRAHVGDVRRGEGRSVLETGTLTLSDIEPVI